MLFVAESGTTLMQPLLSICIATYNRADLLDLCLERLAPLRDCAKPIEIVVSDNASTDRTPEVIESHRARNPLLRTYRFPENRGPVSNGLNACRKAQGELVVFLADDDSLVIDNLFHHVETMEQNRNLVAIFADWIAWDDQNECELHRNFGGVDEFTSFGPDAPLDLLNYVLNRQIHPEVAVYRRNALLRAQAFYSRSWPYHLTMYRLSRLGRVAFDPFPFYREHRVLKDGFQRTHWSNMEMQFHMIGDELRLGLEGLVLLAIQDAGARGLPEEQAQRVRQSIDRQLHSRIGLEVNRACARKDWIMAVELRRRFVLWHGSGTADDERQDALTVVIPAALQAIQQTYRSLSDVPGICLRGFESGRVAQFFGEHFPDTPVLGPNAAQNGGAGALIVHRDEQTFEQDASVNDPGRVLVLQRLLDLYRVNKTNIDVRGL